VTLQEAWKAPSLKLEGVAQRVLSDRGSWHEIRVSQGALVLDNDEESPPRGWPVALKLLPGVRYRAIAEETDLPKDRKAWPKDNHQDSRRFVFHNLARRPLQLTEDASSAAAWIGVWTDGLAFRELVGEEGNGALKEGRVYRVTVIRLD